jgi:hypothetical protein
MSYLNLTVLVSIKVQSSQILKINLSFFLKVKNYLFIIKYQSFNS